MNSFIIFILFFYIFFFSIFSNVKAPPKSNKGKQIVINGEIEEEEEETIETGEGIEKAKETETETSKNSDETAKNPHFFEVLAKLMTESPSDDEFVEFVKDQSTQDGYTKEQKEMQARLDKDKLQPKPEAKQMNESKIKANLGIMYLMSKEKWDCENIEFKDDKKRKEKFSQNFAYDGKIICGRFKDYLDVIYEYFFRVYAQTANDKSNVEKPNFTDQGLPGMSNDHFLTIRTSLCLLAAASKFYFHPLRDRSLYETEYNYKLATYLEYDTKLWLVNRADLNQTDRQKKDDTKKKRETFKEMLEKMAKEAKELATDPNLVQTEPILGWNILRKKKDMAVHLASGLKDDGLELVDLVKNKSMQSFKSLQKVKGISGKVYDSLKNVGKPVDPSKVKLPGVD